MSERPAANVWWFRRDDEIDEIERCTDERPSETNARDDDDEASWFTNGRTNAHKDAIQRIATPPLFFSATVAPSLEPNLASWVSVGMWRRVGWVGGRAGASALLLVTIMP